MMKFRTEIQTPTFPFKISYNDSLFFIGSCFSDHIGSYFSKAHFKSCLNPFGTLFNPSSISQNLQLLISQKQLPEIFIYYYNNYWLSFAHHGKFNHTDKNIFLRNIEHSLNDASIALATANYLFITFGTAFVYNFLPRNIIVANCHKIPNTQFQKTLLSVDQIVEMYLPLLQQLKSLNPNLITIFTVSPIRHLADGFHQNQISKATLLLAIDKLIDNKSSFYFPAYEILLDDLRDYRFYDSDLCHPAPMALEYIQSVIDNSLFTLDTLHQKSLIDKENKFLNHRPLLQL